MKIILLKDVPKIGRKGNIINASDGYARNFLIPKKIAQIATDLLIKENDLKKKKEIETINKKSEEIKKNVQKIIENKFNIKVKTGKNKEVFTSVHCDEIKKEVFNFIQKNYSGNKLEMNDILIESKPIKDLGEHIVDAKIGKGDIAKKIKIKIEIVGE